jgi:hypothetical protein
MATREELEALSSKELHDRAVRRAARHLDVKFFWDLLSATPAAEAAAGEMGAAEADVQSAVARLNDITESGRGEVADVLRPFYIDYLVEHGD